MLLLSSVQDAEVSGFQIVAACREAARRRHPVHHARRRQARVQAQQLPEPAHRRHHARRRSRVFRSADLPASTQTTTSTSFKAASSRTTAGIAYSLENTQVYGLVFINSLFLGNANGQIGLATDQNRQQRRHVLRGSAAAAPTIRSRTSRWAIPTAASISITNAIFEKFGAVPPDGRTFECILSARDQWRAVVR